MMKRLAIACSVALLAAASMSRAAEPFRATISPETTLVTWSGSFNAEHILTPAPDLRCLEGACDIFVLTVELGADHWISNPGAIEVAIRFAYDGVTDLDLVVRTARGDEVGRSEGVDSNAESVFLRDLPDGDYQVVVIPSNTINPDGDGTPVEYEGLAQVEPDAPPGDGADLLPNLVSFPPSNFHVATALNLIPFPENPLLSCYAEETLEAEEHPTRCLRFDQTIANVGAGKLELRFATDEALTDRRMIQRIYADDGGFRDVRADEYELHPVHGHVHYRGFGQSKLYAYDWATRARGALASTGSKVGFCVIDVVLLDGYWGQTGNGPRAHTFPTCNIPTDGPWMVQGIDIGWADVYGWNLADQYIDISNVPDGLYELEQLANPAGSVLEETLADNVASTVICLDGNDVRPVTTDQQAAAC